MSTDTDEHENDGTLATARAPSSPEGDGKPVMLVRPSATDFGDMSVSI